MLLQLRVALTKQFGSAGSALYIKIGDGRLCMQWPHAIVLLDNIVRVIQCGSAHYIKIGDGRLCMQWPRVGVEPTGNSLTTLVPLMQSKLIIIVFGIVFYPLPLDGYFKLSAQIVQFRALTDDRRVTELASERFRSADLQP